MFDQKDLIHLKNLQRLMAKVKAELDMQEVMAASEVLRWMAQLAIKIEDSVKSKALADAAAKAAAAIPPPVAEQPKKKNKKSVE